MADTKPKPPRVIARKRNGAPRRLDVPAQHLQRVVDLLRTLDDPEAIELVEEFAPKLQPICWWSSPRRERWGNYPAWGFCSRPVAEPSHRCTEHSHWPLAPGAVDPFPSRCTATLDRELDHYRWVRDSRGLRCPYPVRPGSDRCPHHDPLPDELCSRLLDDKSGQCQVPESIYPCPDHRQIKLQELESALAELSLKAPCALCSAPEMSACVTRTGRKVDTHKKRLVAAHVTAEAKELLRGIEFYKS